MNVLIIDDDLAAQNVLRIMLEEHFPQLKIVGMAQDIPSAVKIINEHQPDLLFLDVNMPGQNGFRLFEYFDAPHFQVIFTTAFPEYALKAFEVSALDYLIKPIRISQLKSAVEKALRSKGQTTIGAQVDMLKDVLNINHIHKIALPVRDKILFIDVDHIIYLQADSVYTHVISINDKIFLSKGLKEFEYILNENIHFSRVHRSYIINVKYIKEYLKHDGTLLMENGDLIPVSKDRRQRFEELIKDVLIGHNFRL